MFVLPDLEQCLTLLLANVPAGKVTTPRALAAALGLPQAAMWVARFTLRHPHRARCPCHRVVRAGGLLGGYVTGDLEEKQRRLREDGVMCAAGRVDLAAHGFQPRCEHPPLAELVGQQEDLAQRLRFSGGPRRVATVGGVDVSYRGELAFAAYVECAWPSGEVLWSATVSTPIAFPYLPSLLTFRELPAMLAAVDAARTAGNLGDVLLVDGAGRLHPRSAGIAAHLGVVADLPTIGVTKRLLHGMADALPTTKGETALVRIDGQAAGYALAPGGRSRRPLYVSPGHRTTLALTERIVPALLHARRLPAPLYWADRLSRREAQR
ncbi:MAG: endonuclease V [Pirellulales bacterium]